MISIVSYNIRGIVRVSKQAQFRVWVDNNRPEIILLQELHMTKIEQLETFKISFTDYSVVCSLGNWSHGGVLIMFKKHFRLIDSSTDLIGRIVCAKLNVNNISLNVVNVYAPSDLDERKSFFLQLRSFIPSGRWTLVGGDFNCVSDSVRDRHNAGTYTDNKSFPILLHEVITPLQLYELYCSKHPRTTVYSFHALKNDFHSRIDMFFGTKSIRNITENISYEPIGLSDHDSVKIILNISSPAPYGRWICNVNVLSKQTFMDRFHEIWKVFLSTADFNSTDWWFDFKISLTLLLQDEAKELFRETRLEVKLLQKQYRLLAENPSPGDFIEMDGIHTNIRQHLEKKTEVSLSGMYEKADDVLSTAAKMKLSNSQSNQSLISFLLHPTKGRVSAIPDMLDVATQFYKDLYSPKSIDTSRWDELFEGLPKLSDNNRDIMEGEITAAECMTALKEMKLRKSPGEDGITVEVWKKIFPIIGDHYAQMLNVSFKCNCFKNGFLRAILTLLKKEGSSEGSMKGFRPLSLMNIDYKILFKVLSLRLRRVICN
ncbi:unnamed protein product [Didymodactylos carnosus]|uniref:Endonuclease/exonuclease/phosphatase domain-containing protein n=2 Tax=Didymodactylos carnosus TaxID=1234261 RepID=A0A8S2MU54_9BILA|nr:unnamed protein product [Didymodactylos carnosus]CAF3970173.1 unnamed protein product [Didymodactylos carnosus]